MWKLHQAAVVGRQPPARLTLLGVLDDRMCRCGVERAESVAAEMRAAMSPLLQR